MPFQKGQSGNPGGRPKRAWTWAGVIQQAVEEKLKGGVGEVKDMVAKSLVAEALKGNVNAQREIMNRMDGMPQQRTDITSGDKPIPILGGATVNGFSTDNSDQETT